MSETSERELVDTSDMVQLHRVFRDALASAPRLIGSVEAHDAARAGLVADFYYNVLRLLHAHHSGEDELLTPKLRERSPGDVESIDRIAAQHHGVETLMVDALPAIQDWRAAPTTDAAAALTSVLARLRDELVAHLDEEEAVILPIASRHVTLAEWNELPGHGLRSFDGDKVWLVLGLIQEQMTREQVEEMNAHMPPPVAAMWTTTGSKAFAEFVAELRR